MGKTMEKFKRTSCKHYLNYIVIAVFTLIFAIISFTGGMPRTMSPLLERMGYSMLLALSLSLVVGFLGELSLGHAGFMCVGAYLGGKIASLLPFGNTVFGFLIAAIIGGLVAAAFGFIIGLPALRLKGDYLAIVTLAAGEIVRVIFMNTSISSFGGALGLATPRFDRQYLFIIEFLMLLLGLFVIQNLLRSKHGRAITAIRDNEIAAKATGINVTKYKLTVFMLSSFFAGIAGVLYSYSVNTIQYTTFDYNYSIEILVMVVLGGMGSINGVLISSAVITFLDVQLQTILTGDFAVLKNIIYAAILILLVIYNNAPALKGFRQKYNFRNLWKRVVKLKDDPAKRHDDEAAWDRVPTKISMDEILSTDLKPGNDYRPDKPTGGNE